MGKRTRFIYGNILVTLMMLFFINCQKESHLVQHINLHDKVPKEIESYIKGKWKLEYEDGGICNCHVAANNSFWTFSGSSVSIINDDSTYVDSIISWSHRNIFGDSVYIMTFYSKGEVPYNIAAKDLFKDTLVLYQPGPDGETFYFSKVN